MFASVTLGFTGSGFSYTAGAVRAPTNICHTGETMCMLFIHASFVSTSVFVCCLSE